MPELLDTAGSEGDEDSDLYELQVQDRARRQSSRQSQPHRRDASSGPRGEEASPPTRPAEVAGLPEGCTGGSEG